MNDQPEPEAIWRVLYGMLESTTQRRPGKSPSRVQRREKEACCSFVNREDEEEWGPRRYGDPPKYQDELPILQYLALDLVLKRYEWHQLPQYPMISTWPPPRAMLNAWYCMRGLRPISPSTRTCAVVFVSVETSPLPRRFGSYCDGSDSINKVTAVEI